MCLTQNDLFWIEIITVQTMSALFHCFGLPKEDVLILGAQEFHVIIINCPLSKTSVGSRNLHKI